MENAGIIYPPIVTGPPIELCSCKDILQQPHIDSAIKAAALRVAPSVVSIITHVQPEEKMILKRTDPMSFLGGGTCVFPGSGVIVESQEEEETVDGTPTYLTTILAPAVLFQCCHTSHFNPTVRVDVHDSRGQLYKGEVLACDSHNNLAVIRIRSDSPLKPAILRTLNDVSSIGVDASSSDKETPFQLGPHSTSSKVIPGTEIISVARLWSDQYEIDASLGVFSTNVGTSSCKELCRVEGAHPQLNGGGPVVNYCGEVIGICFSGDSFLPCNLVSRWWNHYRSCREFIRPWLGVQVVNLYEAPTDFLKKFVKKFPDIITGVVVTEVEQDSRASLFGIQPNDVIIKCNGCLVRSKLEFFGTVWDNAGKLVEFNVLKTTDGDQLNISMTIKETASDKLNGWRHPRCRNLKDYSNP